MTVALTERDRRCLDGLGRVLLPSGHGLPGAAEVHLGERLVERSLTWSPSTLARIRTLVRAWEFGSVLSAYRKPFTKMDALEQRAWVEACYASRSTVRRIHIAALKQLIFLAWASTVEVEDALGYDYRCRRDDEPHGNARPIDGIADPRPPPTEPDDYFRVGPAVRSGAIPVTLMSKRGFVGREPGSRLEVLEWPAIPERVSVDVLVIGSGAGGSVAAATLAEMGADVLVVEEGHHFTKEDFVGPAFDRFQRFCRDHGFTQVMGKPPIPLPLGRAVGGTTVVNSGTCFRAPDRVLRRWESEFGVEGAHPAGMIDHFESVEDALSVRPVPWNVLGPNGMAAHYGAVALGYSGGPLLRNITDCHGCGQCAFGCPTDAKQAMHISYLPRAQRAGARIFGGCAVRRILQEGDRVVGAEATVSSRAGTTEGMLRIDAKHVVVSAGAIHTPALLDASGIPDPSGQTGRNLRIHPATGVGGIFGGDVVNWKGTLQSYYIDQFFDTHELMFEATTTIPSIGAGSLPGIGAAAMAELSDFRKMATLGFYVSDTSRGRVVRLPGGDILPVYRLNELDSHRVLVGLSVAAEVLLEAGATRVYPGIPGLDWISAREDLAQLAERRVRPEQLRLTAFHPMGTARMGADPATAVVDPYGRHHAVPNLWVADASTFPTCVGVNPQVTIMAFSKRTAERIAKE